ncbi:hypothetical protein LB565_27085 [Mesorhizobium sp. CA14]|uniref:hypothetical protein n=1 Tax=Mesorhizobium sp. CA14 TaxID=2876642 RepID=UPI001CCF8CDE|nr:hypothetical protein [Mesorhizobium sp. CA14]MBZ9851657.1 hypothetical protein [Mesorhizobium sp. CA14]
MADILTTGPIIVRRLKLLRRSFPRLAIGASLNAMSGLVGDTLKMAYVEPYASLGRQSQVVPDDHLEGRDPTW